MNKKFVYLVVGAVIGYYYGYEKARADLNQRSV